MMQNMYSNPYFNHLLFQTST